MESSSSGAEEGQPPHPRPIEEVLPSAELLAHYKSRIDEFERERSELLAAVDRCAAQRDEVHRLEWENRKRADEIKELQKALSDAQQFLFEERQRLLLLQAENDELKLQEIQDRQRIQQLLAMTQPMEQTITYKQGGVPSSVTAYPKTTQGPGNHPAAAGMRSSTPAGAAAFRPAARAVGRGQQQTAAAAAAVGDGGERVLRTVFLPTVDTDFLLLKVESLQAQLHEQKQLHEERVAALLTDRQLRAQEEERQRSNLMVQVESLSKQVKQLEDALQTTTRDYILARRERQEAQDAAAAAQAQMVSEVSAARSQLTAVKRQARADTEKAAATAEAKTREYVDKFRDQVRAREEELMNLTSLHTATKAAADKRIAALEARVTKLLDANRQLELRRQLDVDGWTADVTSLRKALAAVDRKLLQMRLIDRLDDDERLDALLDQLEKRIPDNQQLQSPAGAAAAQGIMASSRPGAGRPRSTGAPAAGAQHSVRAHARGKHVSAAAAGRTGRPRSTAPVPRRREGSLGQRDQAAGMQQQQPGWNIGELGDAAGAAEAVSSHDDEYRQGLGDDDGDDATTDSISSSAAPSSIKSGLAAELSLIRQQLEQLELRAGQKAARALAGLPGAGDARRLLS